MKQVAQVGDEVTVRFVVTDVQVGQGGRRRYYGDQAWAHEECVIEVHVRPLGVGDVVSWPEKYGNFKIVAVHGDRAWIVDGDYYHSPKLSELKRVGG